MSDYFGEIDTTVHYRDRMKYVTAKRNAYQTHVRPDKDVFSKFITLLTCGVLIIEEGYGWNGADVVMDRKSNKRASLIHDALIDLIQHALLDVRHKDEVDWEFYHTCREDKMWLMPAITEFWGVQWHKWNRSKPWEVKICP